MKSKPAYFPCPHCKSDDSVSEDLMRYSCIECGWWGPSPDKIIYEPEDELRESGQVPRRAGA